MSFLTSFSCLPRSNLLHPDHHHHLHRHICGYHTCRPATYSLLPFSYPQLLHTQTLHPLLRGPLSVVPPRLRSGCRLPPPGVGVRSLETDSTNPWRMTRRACGARISNRASRRPWRSTHPVAGGRSSSLMRARCTVRPALSSYYHVPFSFWMVWWDQFGWQTRAADIQKMIPQNIVE